MPTTLSRKPFLNQNAAKNNCTGIIYKESFFTRDDPRNNRLLIIVMNYQFYIKLNEK